MLSFALGGTTLAFSLWVGSTSVGIWGPFLYFPFFGTPVIAGMMALRAAVVRKAAIPPAGIERTLEAIALGWMLAPTAGCLMMLCKLGMLEGMCGVASPRDAVKVLAYWAHIWGAGELVVIMVLVHRYTAAIALSWYKATATILTLILAPPLAVLACATTWNEIDRGGAGMAILVPAAVGAGSTWVTWTRGRPSATAAACRRLVGVALWVAVGMFAVLWKEPVRNICESFWTTHTWRLVSVHELGPALLMIGGLLLLARDPPAGDRA
jgi:hypothetical protein